MVEHRFERDGIVSIAYNGDCMEGMKMFGDKQFDLACVDPPYGIGEDGSKNHTRSKIATSKNYKSYAGNDAKPPSIEYFEYLRKISLNQIVWGANHYISRLPYDSPCWIVWDKDNGQNDFADCELAYTSFPTAVRQFTFKWHGMLQQNMKKKEERIHPNQKPVALYKWIFKNYAKEGQWVIDTHLGSQSSRIAAYEAGLNFIGFELDEDYFKQGCERFDWHVKQLKLF